MQTVKRTIRNIIETNLSRQLKLPRDVKKQKVFQMLTAANDEVVYRRKQYAKEYKGHREPISGAITFEPLFAPPQVARKKPGDRKKHYCIR